MSDSDSSSDFVSLPPPPKANAPRRGSREQRSNSEARRKPGKSCRLPRRRKSSGKNALLGLDPKWCARRRNGQVGGCMFSLWTRGGGLISDHIKSKGTKPLNTKPMCCSPEFSTRGRDNGATWGPLGTHGARLAAWGLLGAHKTKWHPTAQIPMKNLVPVIRRKVSEKIGSCY